MNPSDPNDSLSHLLADWRVQPPMDPNFRPAVWQRLQQPPRPTWSAYVRARLTSWTVVAAAAIATAGWTGRTFARAQLEERRERMVVSYLGQLDPRVLAKIHPAGR